MMSGAKTCYRFVTHRLISEFLLASAAVGVSFMQFANKNSMRNIYIIGLSLFLGISVPQYFNEYTSSAGRGPARTNAGWVFEASPFTPITFTNFCILASSIHHLHVLLHFSDAAFLDCNNILHLCHVASWCLYSWTLTSKHIFLQFNDIINTVFASGPTVALIVASVLDNTLEARGNDSDRGLSWFTPFLRRHKGYSDPRNDEFYSFPIRVHDFVPSRFLWLSHERCYCACKSLCSW